MKKYGYIRVSSKDQNPERQYKALLDYGVRKEHIYADYMSGKDFNRPNYMRLVKKLKSGDVLVIKSIDRLGRNYDEIIEQWRNLCRVRQVDIEVIEFPLLNTNQCRDGLTGIFISDITLQILAYLAQTEREFIRQRQAEGIAIAREKGVRFGAKKIPPSEMYDAAFRLWEKGDLSIRGAAEMAGMSPSTFYRRCTAEASIKRTDDTEQNRSIE